jgi:hypothetical protein
MKLNLKDESKEWRKSALLAAFGLALMSSLLRWRHVLSQKPWLFLLAGLAGVVVAALIRPKLFRPYHLFSMRLGYAITQFIGRLALFIIFIILIIPMGFLLRLMGKDPLQLKRPAEARTYWRTAKAPGPLDRLF